MIEHIYWLGHGSFRLNGHQRYPCIYIDPWRIPADSPPADAILITHDHYDHFSTLDIERIITPTTQIITNQWVANLLEGVYQVTVLRPWQSINIGDVNIKTTPAYTQDDYHPKDREYLGFVLAMNRYDIYYAGDTDFVPELAAVRCDIAILPVSAKEGMMTILETVDFVASLKPQIVIPSHYGTIEGGTLLDAKALETALDGLAQVQFLDAPV